MHLATLDAGKLLALMLFGGVSALAGLWLMFRPKAEGTTAKLKLFGIKFESSSAGLLVFLIGAAFLATPVFVREAPTAMGDEAQEAGAGSVEPGREGSVLEGSPGEAPEEWIETLRAPGAIRIDGEEVEPNDSLAAANVIPLGSTIAGKADGEDVDYFRVVVPEDVTGDIVINAYADERFQFVVFDDLGTELDRNDQTFAISGETYTAPIEHRAYHVMLRPWSSGRAPSYQLTVGARPE